MVVPVPQGRTSGWLSSEVINGRLQLLSEELHQTSEGLRAVGGLKVVV